MDELDPHRRHRRHLSAGPRQRPRRGADQRDRPNPVRHTRIRQRRWPRSSGGPSSRSVPRTPCSTSFSARSRTSSRRGRRSYPPKPNSSVTPLSTRRSYPPFRRSSRRRRLRQRRSLLGRSPLLTIERSRGIGKGAGAIFFQNDLDLAPKGLSLDAASRPCFPFPASRGHDQDVWCNRMDAGHLPLGDCRRRLLARGIDDASRCRQLARPGRGRPVPSWGNGNPSARFTRR